MGECEAYVTAGSTTLIAAVSRIGHVYTLADVQPDLERELPAARVRSCRRAHFVRSPLRVRRHAPAGRVDRPHQADRIAVRTPHHGVPRSHEPLPRGSPARLARA